MQKLIDVLEVTIDRGETDVGNLIDPSEALQNHIAQLMRSHSRQRTRAKLDLDIVNYLIELFGVDVTFDGGTHQADQQLIAIEALLGAIGLYDLNRIFATLEGCKTVVARAAFTTPLNRIV